jgi:cation-transporting P-type ATPase I
VALLDPIPAGVRRPIGAMARPAAGAVDAVGGVVRAVVAPAVRPARALLDDPRLIRPTIAPLFDLPHRHRRAWTTADRAHVELREVPPAATPDFVDRLERTLTRHRHVHWAEVLTRPGRVVVAHDGQTTVTELIAVVEGVEAAAGVDHHPFGVDRPDHPADPEPVLIAGAALLADAGGLILAVTGRLARRRPLPFEIDTAALIAVLQNVPALRGAVDRRLSHPLAEFGLAVGNGIASGLTQGALGPLVDVALRVTNVIESEARRLAWEQREAELCVAPSDHPRRSLRPFERPAPLAPGPVEQFSERAWVASLGGFGVGLALTRSLDRAAAALLAGLPKAARLGRETYASQVGRLLASRGALIFDPDALRRLDRLDVVCLHLDACRTGRAAIGTVVATADHDPAALARRAALLLDPDHPGHAAHHGEWGLRRRRGDEPDPLPTPPVAHLPRAGRRLPDLVLTLDDRPVAGVHLRHEIDPRTAEIVRRARAAGARVVVATDEPADTDDLDADQVVSPADLTEVVRAEQLEGHGVLVVATGTVEALEVADLGVGLTPTPATPPWGAHVLLRDDLGDVWLVVEAVRLARDVSRQSATLATFGAGAATFLAFGGVVPGTARRVGTATNLATMLAMANGARAGLQLVGTPVPVRRDEVAWHALEPRAVLRRLGSGADGLDPDVAGRLRRLPPSEPLLVTRFGRAVVDELLNPLTPVLAVGAGLSLATGSVADAAMVTSVVAFNAMVGAGQRLRTEAALAALGRRDERPVKVRRSGTWTSVRATRLVPGDVIRLRAGDAVPADCRLLEARAVQADESSLTGESLPVAKDASPSASPVVAERHSMLYEGTSLAAGEADAVVVAVGDDTEARRGLATGEGPPPSGVEHRLDAITTRFLPLSVGAGLGVLGVGLLRGRPLVETAGSGVSLAVAAVPEGLPILATVAQLAASRRLAGRGALVRNPGAVEALGRVDVLCADKTGTLTVGRIRVAALTDGTDSATPTEATGRLRDLLVTAGLATPAPLPGGRLPHPTDRAVIHALGEAGVLADGGVDRWTRIDEIPFEPARSYHATLATDDGTTLLAVKGAPEVVLPRCATRRTARGRPRLGATTRTRLVDQVHELASQGLRVLALAERRWRSTDADAPRYLRVDDGDGGSSQAGQPGDRADGEAPEPPPAGVEELTFVGFVCLADPPRRTAAQAVRGVGRAGVEVIMITGDHPSTAMGVAAEIGLDEGALLTGPEIDELDDEELGERLETTTVCARVTPVHKVRIVRSLQRRGLAVAMTGDGSNDAPAIRLADVGIALGTRATPAARDAADLVVVDDRIETIVDAIGEGRTMWASVRDAVAVLAGGNLGEILFTLGGTVIGGAPPLNARQLLLVNLLTDVAPALAIAMRPPADHTIESLLREGPDRSLGDALDDAVAVRAAATTAAASVAWGLGRVTGTPERASTVALIALVGAQLGQTVAAGGTSRSVLAAGFGSAALMGALVQTPGVSQLVGCRPVGPVGWTIGLSSATAATVGAAVATRMDLGVPDWAGVLTRSPHPTPASAGG